MRASRLRYGFVALLLVSTGLLLSTGGCAPLAVQAVSMAADGVSMAATGKSIADHGLSFAAGQDCTMTRALEGRPICRAPGEVPPAADEIDRVRLALAAEHRAEFAALAQTVQELGSEALVREAAGGGAPAADTPSH